MAMDETMRIASEYFFDGVCALEKGDIDRAESKLLSALQLVPNRPSVLINLSIAYTQRNELDRALALSQKALESEPNNPIYLLQQGTVQLRLGDYEGALGSLVSVIKMNPALAEAQNNCGCSFKGLNRLEEALVSLDKAISLKPDFAEAFNNRGSVLRDLLRPDEALASFDEAIYLKSDYAEAYSNRGNTLRDLRQSEKALASYDRAINLKPDYAEAHNNRGNTLLDLNRSEEAMVSYDKAVSLKPDYAEAYVNRGVALRDLRRLEEALASYDKAISLKPDYAEAYANRGVVLNELRRLEEALASFDMAISLKPDYADGHYNKSILLLAEQQYEGGFSLYPWRWKIKDFGSRQPITSIPPWRGQSVERLLLWAEQGIGDEIFYSPMTELINDEISITLSADKRLHGILKRSFPDLSLVDRAVQKHPINGGFDAQAAVSDLGQLLKVSCAIIKQRRYPFLLASTERTQSHLSNNEFLRRRPVCGVAWKSENKRSGDRKSIDLHDLESLLRMKDITFVNLQYGNVSDAIKSVSQNIGTIVHQTRDLDVFNDIDGLLSLIDCCDIVVTTSNVTAHLAGALGKKAAVLVPVGRGRIWYWHDQPQSIWYPSLRLFSQGIDGNWQNAIKESTAWIRDNI